MTFTPETKEELRENIITYIHLFKDNPTKYNPIDTSIFTKGSIKDWDISNITDFSNLCRDLFVDESSLFAQMDICRWNVAHIQNMEYMFLDCIYFNQPLNAWIVENVQNMRSMFLGCIHFNQPLNSWNVRIVRDMDYMFYGCTSFNQDLSNWDISEGTSMDDIFEGGCPIVTDYKPPYYRRRYEEPDPDPEPITPNPEPEPEEQVDAQQIHKESKKIKYDKLFAFMRDKIHKPMETVNAYYINNLLYSIIDSISDTNTEEKEEQENGIDKIMRQRLNGIRYAEFSPTMKNAVFYSLEYTLLQPNAFKKEYIDNFINDCIHAYNGSDGMTCSAGGLERLVTEMIPASKIMITMPDIHAEKREEYETLLTILSPPIDDHIKDWYQLHKQGTPDAFSAGTSIEEKKANLKQYLLSTFPGEEELIDTKIEEFQHAIGYDEDDFTYGGKRRKTQRRNKKTQRKTQRRNKKTQRKTRRRNKKTQQQRRKK